VSRMGFSVECGATGCEIHIYTPALVTSFVSADVSVVLMGRLYYKSDWKGILRTAPGTDAEFAAAVYAKFGVDGLRRLEGDFALVATDRRKRVVFALRDPMGAFPIYWTEQAEQLILGTAMRPLIDRLPSREVNPEYLADYLLVAGSQSELPGEACVYRGVHRLRPATLLTWDAATGTVRRRGEWDWLEQLSDPDTDSVELAGRALRDVLEPAVRERLRGVTATHVSGGMDSTAIAMLACRAVDGAKPVHGISLVYHHLEALSRERPYVEAAFAHAPALVPHIVEGDDFLDFDSFRDPPVHDEPYPGLWRLAMDRAATDAALRFDATTLLTGLGADETLSVQPYHVADLLAGGHVLQAWRESCEWAYAYQWNAWQVMVPFGLRNLFPAWTRIGSGRLLRRRGELAKVNEWELPPWILPSFAQRYDLRDRARDNARRAYAACKPTSLSVAINSVQQRVGNAVGWSLAAPHGLLITHPFFDPRVISVGLGIQRRITPKPDRLKPVLAAAIDDLLPEPIRTRRSKGHFNELYYLGLSRNTAMLEEMIRQAPCDELAFVDKNLLIEHLHTAALGGAGVRPLQHFNLMVAFLKWLSMQPVWLQLPFTSEACHRVGWI
jgi:asparagine synthase (glutamine-hydrolysing)